MKNPFQYTIRTVEGRDREWIQDLLRSRWGGEFVVLHEDVYYPEQLPGFIAEDLNGSTIGLVTYQITSKRCEIVTINSLVEDQGVGTSLIERVHQTARKEGCDALYLTTTNDNQRAIDFYTKIGFMLKEVQQGAVEEARKIKPSIPLFSPSGVAIRDEWMFEKKLKDQSKQPADLIARR